MRILTWNVNVLRTCLDYHPFSQLPDKNIEGLLGQLGAEIACFQEHKTRRPQLEKSMACPGPYDGFWTFPRSKTGYSGVCTFVDSRYCVPLKAEEGITGLLLDDRGSTMRPPWTEEERVGGYVDMDDLEFLDEVDGRTFEPKKLDMEGRAVVCDFGLFVLFNLYCPNETNDTRRPYKMNFLAALQARVRALVAQGRNVIIAGDINIMRSPMDSGEGGIKTTAEKHYEHPARRIFDDWCAPKGPMVDVVRESWPDREGMFTCWNTKLDARPSNYGSRIDYILCTPGLRPWIKGGDILPKVFGSDHCPVYIDLHETIPSPNPGDPPLVLRDLLNPRNRPPSTAPVYPNDKPRTAPEPPRFATKFFEEFSGKQMTLKNLWAAGAGVKKEKKEKTEKGGEKDEVRGEKSEPAVGATQSDTASTSAGVQSTGPETQSTTDTVSIPSATPVSELVNDHVTSPFSLARTAFNTLDASQPSTSSLTQQSSSTRSVPPPSGVSQSQSAIDMTAENDDEPESSVKLLKRERSDSVKTTASGKAKSAKQAATAVAKGSQPKLASFWKQPKTRTSPSSKAETSLNGARSPKVLHSVSESSSNAAASSAATSQDRLLVEVETAPRLPSATEADGLNAEERDALFAQSLVDAEAEAAQAREIKNNEAAPVWLSLFAKKAPPLCTVHQKQCKDYTVKIPGPNKGKRFWLCSMPVGPGYDTGRSKRPRQDVDPKYRCDFFLWDSANSKREPPRVIAKK